jgi:cytosine deaminase
MCSGAIQLYGISKVIVGENKTFQGPESLLRSQGITLKILQNPECIALMEDFIQDKPELWSEDIGVPTSQAD